MRTKIQKISFFILAFFALYEYPVYAQTIPALVVGNSNYLYASRLDNPKQDATAMSTILNKRGFKVTQLIDADKNQLEKAITDFVRQISQTKKGFFYYAGHGIQSEGKNYLVPIDVKGIEATTVNINTFSLQRLLDEVGKISPEAVTIVLDACRDDPFGSTKVELNARSTSNFRDEKPLIGLGEAGQIIPKGIIVAYGASANQQALDSLGDNDRNPNGVFTRHLIRHLENKSISIQQVLRRVRDSVMLDSKNVSHRQIPSTYDASIPNKNLLDVTVNSASQNIAPLRLPKSIKLIVPAAAGGPTDYIARQFSDRLRSRGFDISIQNVIDISGEKVAAMDYPITADSASFLMSNYPASLRREIIGDNRFKAVSMVAEPSMMLATNMRTNIKNMQTLNFETAKKTTPWRVGISGPGSQSEACLSVLKNQFGASKINGIVTKGMGPALAEMLGGNIDMICDIQPTFEPHVRAGSLRYIANLQEDANSDNEVPTSQAQGYAMVAPNWSAIFAPKQMTTQMITSFYELFKDVVADPIFVSNLKSTVFKPTIPEKTHPLEIEMSLRLGAEINSYLSTK